MLSILKYILHQDIDTNWYFSNLKLYKNNPITRNKIIMYVITFHVFSLNLTWLNFIEALPLYWKFFSIYLYFKYTRF